MQIDNDVKLDYSDVMLVPRTGNSDAPQTRAAVVLHHEGIVPIIAANMDGVGSFEMAIELAKYGVMTALHKHYEVDSLISFFNEGDYPRHFIYSMGINNQDLTKFKHFWAYLNHIAQRNLTICIDVANGYTQSTFDAIHQLKRDYPVRIIAGNVVTGDGVFHLSRAGADIVKVGIGPGSVCTTRRLTGIGYPQFSAVYECVDAARQLKRWGEKQPMIIADGGITCPGDVAKALGTGADYVMIGGAFAGHNEGGGTLCDLHGNENRNRPAATGPYVHLTHRKFYGMASKTAQDKHNGGVANYRASEGKEVIIPNRGPIKGTIEEYLGGLRSTCCYLGTKYLADIKYAAKYIKVSRQLNGVFGS